MGMFTPPHPGETLREDVLPALGLTVTEAARQLGVSRVALSRVLHGKAAISPDMAWKARLEPIHRAGALRRHDTA
jgi:addiction module HigA family antidote